MGSEKAEARYKRHGRILFIVSIITGILSILSIISNIPVLVSPDEYIGGTLSTYYAGIVGGGTLSTEDMRIFAIGDSAVALLNAIIGVVAAVVGIQVSRGKGRAEQCEMLALVMGGLVVFGVLGMTFVGIPLQYLVIDLCVSIIIPLIYGIAAYIDSKDEFWKKVDDQSKTSVSDFLNENVPTRKSIEEAASVKSHTMYTLDADGRLAPKDDNDDKVDGAYSSDKLNAGVDISIRRCEREELVNDKFTRALLMLNQSFTEVHGNFVEGILAIPNEAISFDGASFDSTAYEGDSVAAIINKDKNRIDNNGFTHAHLCFRVNENGLYIRLDDILPVGMFAMFADEKHYTAVDAADVLCGYLDYFIHDDVIMLACWRDRLNRLERILSTVNDAEIPSDFGEYIADAREKLYELRKLYENIENLANTILLQDDLEIAEATRRHYAKLRENAKTLAENAQQIKDYAREILELRQAMTATRQADVSQILTIVATICMSVSLISSWYGMNFDNMPELHGTFGYLIVVMVCVFVVIAEMIYFKKKKWF